VSNLDKHTPLSAEELFKRIEETSSDLSDMDDMDDFEKEALEGFKAYSSSEKAVSLNEELHVAISKKVNEIEEQAPKKNKIIWFSAAASIVLIILISVFFFNQSKKETLNNLALSESPKKNSQLLEEQKKVPEAVVPADAVSKTEELSISQKKIQQQEIAIQTSANSNTNQRENSKLADYSALSQSGGAKPVTTEVYNKFSKGTINDEVNKNLDGDANGVAIVEKQEALKKEALASLESEETVARNNDKLATKNNESDLREESESKAKYKADKKALDKDSKDSEKSTKVAVGESKNDITISDNVTTTANNNSTNSSIASAPSSVSLSTKAPEKTVFSGIHSDISYYNGGVVGLQKDVLSYLKSSNSSIKLIGTFKINGAFDKNDKFKLASVIQTSGDNCHCIDVLTKALNSLNKWTPNIKGESSKDFIVQFNLNF
jgi:hypothetical protein